MAESLRNLLSWYNREKRALPWRCPSGRVDPYAVWLSEVMCQQTSVAVASRYFERFRRNWPTVQALAAARLEDVLACWSGLGYYSRARNLHASARYVASRMNGHFPVSYTLLIDLPGVGDYTAAAIASIVSREARLAIDGNIKRVCARVFGLDCAATQLARVIRHTVEPMFQGLEPFRQEPGDVNQGLMEIGALICRPRNPRCEKCPLSNLCVARREGTVDSLPQRRVTGVLPHRKGDVFVIARRRAPCEEILLIRFPENGVFSGMLFPPTSTWTRAPTSDGLAPFREGAGIRKMKTEVTHTFSHFFLTLSVWQARVSPEQDCRSILGEIQSCSALIADNPVWIARSQVRSSACPALVHKVLATTSDRG